MTQAENKAQVNNNIKKVIIKYYVGTTSQKYEISNPSSQVGIGRDETRISESCTCTLLAPGRETSVSKSAGKYVA